MKKHIDFVALDSSLVKWLLDKLRTSAISTPSVQELSEGLRNLMDGTAGSLMLELGEGEFPTAGGDTICCGTLSIDLRLRKVNREGIEISLTPKSLTFYIFWPAIAVRCSQKNRFTRLCGKTITYWTIAISWRLSENFARKSNQIRIRRNTS